MEFPLWLSGFKYLALLQLQCMQQVTLGSGVAVAVAQACNCCFDLTLQTQELPYAAGAAIKNKQTNKLIRKKKKRNSYNNVLNVIRMCGIFLLCVYIVFPEQHHRVRDIQYVLIQLISKKKKKKKKGNYWAASQESKTLSPFVLLTGRS